MKIKQLLKILFYNLLILGLLLVGAELIVGKKPMGSEAEYMNKYNQYAKKAHVPFLTLKYAPTVQYQYSKHIKSMRPVCKESGKNKKRPVLFFGCSFTYGSLLENNQTLPYKINKLTGRRTYNRGVGGAGPQLMLHELQDKNFYKQVPDAEYIVYTFIWDHILRLYSYEFSPFTNEENQLEANTRYDFKNGKLVEITPRFLPFYSLYSVKRIQTYLKMKNSNNPEKSFKLFTEIMRESLEQAKIHYPNVKFVILLYKDSGLSIFNAEQISALRKEGFIVIDAEKLVGHELSSAKYRAGDREHPSEQAWNEVAPKLVKNLNL